MGIFHRKAVRFCRRAGAACIFIVIATTAAAATTPADASAQQQLRQQERERALRDRQEVIPDARLPALSSPIRPTYPKNESPCFVISSIELTGDAAEQFKFALAGIISGPYQALGRCLGTEGINVALAHIQDAIIARGLSPRACSLRRKTSTPAISFSPLSPVASGAYVLLTMPALEAPNGMQCRSSPAIS
jgi:hypothetical protein